MGHGLEIKNGKASMMYAGSNESPWHRQGVFLGETAVTAEEAIVAAGMDWEVSTHPIYSGFAELKEVPDFKAIIRQDTGDVLGIRGNKYTPYQNREAFKVLDPFIGKDKAIWHTAGVLGKGERIWIQAKLPGHIEVTKNDIVEKYFLLQNSHNGASGIKLLFSPQRVVCQNTLQMALVGGESSIMNIRHTKNHEIKIKQALKIMGLIEKVAEDFEITAKKMYGFKMTEADIDNYLADIINIGKEVKEKVELYKDKSYIRYREYIEGGAGTNIPGVKGSLWGCYNAVTESIDHPTRKIKDELQYSQFGAGRIIKDRAWKSATRLIR